MSDPTHAADTNHPNDTGKPTHPSPLARHAFLLRRLHSLTGILPVGVFVVFHLFTNVQMLFGTFDHEVSWIHSLPALLFLEIFGLWLPIAFHAALGIYYIFSGKHNSYTYRYGGNIRYSLQRWTAWVSLVFIVYHVATLRWGWTFGGLTPTPFFYNMDDATLATLAGIDAQNVAHAATAYAMQHGPLNGWLTTVFYIVGVTAVVYHWSNGLWTAAISWGITTSEAAMKRWGYLCTGMFVVLMVFGLGAIWAARTYHITHEDHQLIREYIQQVQAGELPDKPPAPHD